LLPVRYDFGNDLAAALQNPHDGDFVFAASAGNVDGALVLVHVPRLASDEGFVGFNLAGKFVETPHSESKANPVIHEPCRLLGNANGPVNLVAADSVFAVHYLPHRGHPLVQTDGGILNDRSGFQGELRSRMLGAAVPAIVLL